MASPVAERTRQGAKTDEPPVVVGSRFGTVVALRAASGEVLWRRTPGPDLSTLAHSGDVVWIPTDMPTPVRRDIEVAVPASGDERRPQGRIFAQPALLAALRISDGALLWLKEGWSMPRGMQIILDGGTLFATAPTPAMGEALVYALDAQTGETRWSFDTGKPWGITKRLIAARGGRVYVWVEAETGRHLRVLDGRSGATIWGRAERDMWLWLSPGGKLAVLHTAAHAPATASVLNAEDGSEVAALPTEGGLLGITDDGTAYLHAEMRFRGSSVRAIRIGDGAEVWRADGIGARHLTIAGDTLFFAQRTHSHQLAEVVALDAATGRLLWRWHSPRHLLGLLKLWGLRTPQVLVFALAQARRSLIRAREQHNWRIVLHEVIRGQWRRPSALVWDVCMAVRGDHVYVGTSLGLFALNATNGRLLWHALPTTDVALVAPGVVPERVKTPG
jgi:outer membrane protein assembly factor BamB